MKHRTKLGGDPFINVHRCVLIMLLSLRKIRQWSEGKWAEKKSKASDKKKKENRCSYIDTGKP